MRTYYIGLCNTYHDPALALVNSDGDILYAEASERHLQCKRAINAEADDFHGLAELLAEHCQDAEAFVIGINWQQTRPLYEKLSQLMGWLSPRGILKTSRKPLHAWLEMYKLHYMQACQHHAIRRSSLNLARLLRKDFSGIPVRFRFFDHHLSHAALACYASPFEDAACAVIDSYGETGSMAFYEYRNGRINPRFVAKGPQSLGFYYMKLTELCGFDWLDGEEWKTMGLASYGRLDEDVMATLRGMVTLEGLRMVTQHEAYPALLKQLESHGRKPSSPPESVANLAFTGQRFFTETVNQLLTHFHGLGISDNLALAGGCALNSVCNGQIKASTPFEQVFVPSAPADDGTALGAALLAFREERPAQAIRKEPLSAYLGSRISDHAVERFARYSGVPCQHLPDGAMIPAAAKLLAEGRIMGWLQGRAEFGPRALGNRSILADPRSASMGDRVNSEVKFRESFRPFAPSVLHEYGPEFFSDYQESPYMERTLKFRPEAKDRVPAVVHVDGTGRLQTVKKDWNPRFHGLLNRFMEETGVPLLLNTSFNVMGKPIAHSVEDAFGVFLGSGLDVLVINDFLFSKQPERP